MAAKRKRETSKSIARQLLKSLPRVSPLLREAFHTTWTDAQCDAWGRRTKAVEVIRQANEWLAQAQKALASEHADDVPYSVQRLAWLAALTAALEDEVAGTPTPAATTARQSREEALMEARRVRARLFSRLVLLVGGDEERGAALSVSNQGARNAAEVKTSLLNGIKLLTRWRQDPRLRVLADELRLDEALIARAEASARVVQESVLAAPTPPPDRGDPPQVNRVEGRVLRELRALQLAFDTAREDGLTVPKLRVRPVLKPILSARKEAGRRATDLPGTAR